MKMNKLILGCAVLLLGTFVSNASEKETKSKAEVVMPEKVQAIVEHSCFGCHNTDSKNDDAKEKLDFKTLDELSSFKKIGKYRDIVEVLEKGEMPPKKFLEKFPDRKLSDEESQILKEWVEKEANALIKN